MTLGGGELPYWAVLGRSWSILEAILGRKNRLKPFLLSGPVKKNASFEKLMFETDLGPILGRFWTILPPQMGPKWHPKTTQKRSKKRTKKQHEKRPQKGRFFGKKSGNAANLPYKNLTVLPPTPPLRATGVNGLQLSAASRKLEAAFRQFDGTPPHTPPQSHRRQ